MGSKNEKWNSANIIEFLEIYENYPVLWNSSLKEYKNRNLRDAAFKELVDQLQSTFPNITLELVRSKIKVIKTVVSQECIKITKSKKSGAGTDELYEPKLSWFDAARFLMGSSSSRPSTSTLDKELQKLPTVTDVSDIDDIENVDSPISSKRQPQQKKQINKSETPGMQPPRSKKFKRSEIHKDESIVDKLHEISQTVRPVDKSGSVTPASDELSHFGEYVTAQLRLLNPINSLKAQKAIQNILIAERIKSLEQNMQNQSSSAISPVTSIATTGSVSSDVEGIHQKAASYDLLNTALENSFILQTGDYSLERNDSENLLLVEDIEINSNTDDDNNETI